MVFDQVWDNIPFTLDPGYWHEFSCCDCGLIHKMRMTIDTAGEDQKEVIILEVKALKGKTKKNRKKPEYKGVIIPERKVEE